VALPKADFASGEAELTDWFIPNKGRQRCMKRNLPGPEGLAAGGASAVLRGLTVGPPRPAPRALHPLPRAANAAYAEFSDRLMGPRVTALPAEAATMLAMAAH
jgi:hypothetical protein